MSFLTLFPAVDTKARICEYHKSRSPGFQSFVTQSLPESEMVSVTAAFDRFFLS